MRHFLLFSTVHLVLSQDIPCGELQQSSQFTNGGKTSKFAPWAAAIGTHKNNQEVWDMWSKDANNYNGTFIFRNISSMNVLDQFYQSLLSSQQHTAPTDFMSKEPLILPWSQWTFAGFNIMFTLASWMPGAWVSKWGELLTLKYIKNMKNTATILTWPYYILKR